MSKSAEIERRPQPGSREVHQNHPKRVGAPVSGSPAKGLSCATAQSVSRWIASRLRTATTPVVRGRDADSRIAVDVNQALQNSDALDFSAAGQAAIEVIGSMAELSAVGTVTPGGVIELRGDVLQAAREYSPSPTAAKPTATPEDVKLIGRFGVSGMPHSRDVRRRAVPRRPGGGTQPNRRATGQLRRTSHDGASVAGELADGAVMTLNLANSGDVGQDRARIGSQRITRFREPQYRSI